MKVKPISVRNKLNKRLQSTDFYQVHFCQGFLNQGTWPTGWSLERWWREWEGTWTVWLLKTLRCTLMKGGLKLTPEWQEVRGHGGHHRYGDVWAAGGGGAGAERDISWLYHRNGQGCYCLQINFGRYSGCEVLSYGHYYWLKEYRKWNTLFWHSLEGTLTFSETVA